MRLAADVREIVVVGHALDVRRGRWRQPELAIEGGCVTVAPEHAVGGAGAIARGARGRPRASAGWPAAGTGAEVSGGGGACPGTPFGAATGPRSGPAARLATRATAVEAAAVDGG